LTPIAHGPPQRSAGRASTTAAPVLAARPPELAQLVWRRALALVDPGAPRDQLGVAIDLLRVAQHNPSVMLHASTLGRTYLRGRADDNRARAAAQLLHAAITLLGVKPSTSGVTTRQPSASSAS
jgi:hypothetical protein